MPTVLVADDDPSTRRLLAEILGRAGYAVRLAADGLEALAEIEREPPDLVLADIVMPGLGGAALLARLRSSDRHLPVVLMSAYAHESGAIAVPFVAKPFARRDLLAAVEGALGRVARREAGVPATVDAGAAWSSVPD